MLQGSRHRCRSVRPEIATGDLDAEQIAQVFALPRRSLIRLTCRWLSITGSPISHMTLDLTDVFLARIRTPGACATNNRS